MVRTKRVSRKEKRPASSTQSSQDEDSRPRKAPKQDENNSDSGSSIQMINSSNLKRYRKTQRQREQQQLAAQGHDDGTNPHGIRPPPGSSFRRRPQAIPQPVPEEEEEQQYEGEFETSYGGNDSEERDQRISSWAGSVAGAGAGDPNAGVEYGEASVRSSSPSPDGDEDDEGKDPDDATEEEDAIPSIEAGNARPSTRAVARTRAAMSAQLPTHTLRRSARLLRQNPQVPMARIPETHFDPVAYLNKSSQSLRDLSNRYPRAPAGIVACTAADSKARRQVFFDGPRPNGSKAVVKPFNRGNFKSRGDVFEGNGAAIKSGEAGRDNTVGADLGANEQNAAIKYFGRDHLTNHGYAFASNNVGEDSSDSSSNDASNAQPFPNGDYNSNEASTCAFSTCPCHRANVPGLTRRYVIHVPGGAWVFHPTGKSHHDRDYFPDSGYEQHNLDYGSEPREDRDYFPIQTCVLDYDGGAKMKEEPASEAGDHAEGYGGVDDNGEDGSASGDFPPANENGVGDGGSDDGDPDDEEQGPKQGLSDSGSDNSDEDLESEESVQGSEDPVVSEDEDDSAEEDEGASDSASDHAEFQPMTTTAIPRNTDPWGRIRPPQAQGIPSPPRVLFPSAPVYYVPIPQSGDLGPRRDGTTTTLHQPNYGTAGRIRPPQNQVPRLARRGGLPDTPSAGPQTRQNTAANRMRDQPLSPGHGYVSVSIAEQQAAQMLHADEGVRTVEGEDGDGRDVDDEGKRGPRG